MDLNKILLHNLSTERITGYLRATSEFSVSFREIIWLIIYITAIIGLYFWYIHKKYRGRYKFESPSKPEFLSDIVTKGIEGFTVSIELFSYIKNFIYLLVIFGIIAYYIAGFNGVLFIAFLGLISWLKMIFMYYSFLREESSRNNYASIYNILSSFNRLLIAIIETVFSVKVIYVIIFIIISLFVFLIQIELFYLWALVWILIYLPKVITTSYEIELIKKPPLFAKVEYLSGETDSHLILYQTTSTDYRFKEKDEGEELIIPASSIKKIYYDYDSELSDLDDAIKINPPRFKKAANKSLEHFLNSAKPRLWYRKAVIYSKRKDFESAEKCLTEAIKLDNKFREIARSDRDLGNLRDEDWFIKLTDEKTKSSADEEKRTIKDIIGITKAEGDAVKSKKIIQKGLK